MERIGSDAFDDPLFLSKFMLTQVLGCERKFMAERSEPFEWSPPTARGTVMHKAIELSVHWRGEPSPLALVDEALASLQNADKSIGDYLRTCHETERTELRAAAGSTMTQVPGVLPAAEASVEADYREPGTGLTARRADRAVGQAGPHTGPARRNRGRQGDRRLQDGRVLPPPTGRTSASTP